ncbi:3-oxoacyl-ACP synthase III family protein [Kutzneria sp. NPDC052558]|uniref:3-oxoacyl-ACP synthase III family protein n=1 Tax=Kutzneria sp. NPDC052558 TaxID=3364121 RepID=UPI0037CC14E0
MSTRPIGLLGTGSYLPERVVTNEDIAAMTPDATPEWILRKTAIRSRRFAAEHEATSDLAAAAGRAALEHAGLSADRVDYLIVSTSTGDFPQPPTASVVQQLLGAQSAACLDVNVVCAGFVYALELGRSLVATHPGTRALVIAADIYSRILDFTDRRTCALFGDGAGAAVVGEVAEDYGILNIELATSGEHQDLIKVPAGGSRVPPTARTLADGGHFFTMQGRGVRDFVFDSVPPTLHKLLATVGLDTDRVDVFVPHQANSVLLDELVVLCGLTGAHTAKTVEQYGNVGSASVPVALDAAVRSGRVRDGDIVLLSAFGGGMSVGNGVLRWSAVNG